MSTPGTPQGEEDESPEVEQDLSCGICGLDPCDCDRIYDNWRDRDYG